MKGFPLACKGAFDMAVNTTKMNRPRKNASDDSSGIPMLQLSPTVAGEINWKTSMKCPVRITSPAATTNQGMRLKSLKPRRPVLGRKG